MLGRVHHIGDVAGLGSYTETLTAPLPNLADGGYHIVVEVDSRDLVPDSNRSNNTGISSNAFHVSVPLLTIGAPITGTITEGQDIYYRLVVPPGQDLTIAATFAVAMEAEFDLRYQALPDRSTFDQTAPDLSDLTPSLFLPTPQGGSYYILLHGREGALVPQTFTLRADLAPFGVTGFSPKVVSNTGPAILSLAGAHFTPQTTVTLESFSGPSFAASQVLFIDSGHLTATFDCHARCRPATITSESLTAPRLRPLSAIFWSPWASAGNLAITTLAPPKTVYVGGSISVNIDIRNTGDAPVTEPYIIIQATGVVPQPNNDPSDQLPGLLDPGQGDERGPRLQAHARGCRQRQQLPGGGHQPADDGG